MATEIGQSYTLLDIDMPGERTVMHNRTNFFKINPPLPTFKSATLLIHTLEIVVNRDTKKIDKVYSEGWNLIDDANRNSFLFRQDIEYTTQRNLTTFNPPRTKFIRVGAAPPPREGVGFRVSNTQYDDRGRVLATVSGGKLILNLNNIASHGVPRVSRVYFDFELRQGYTYESYPSYPYQDGALAIFRIMVTLVGKELPIFKAPDVNVTYSGTNTFGIPFSTNNTKTPVVAKAQRWPSSEPVISVNGYDKVLVTVKEAGIYDITLSQAETDEYYAITVPVRLTVNNALNMIDSGDKTLLFSPNNTAQLTYSSVLNIMNNQSQNLPDGADEAELQIFDKIGDTFKKGKEWFDRQPTGVKIGVISGGVAAPAVIAYGHNFVSGVGAGYAVAPVVPKVIGTTSVAIGTTMLQR